jgi:stage IV sporulation protein FB
MFQIPPPTKFDLRFSIAGTPIRVSPMFWLIAILLGSTGGLAQIPIWVVVVFVSILIHEMGHVVAFRRYGIRSQIVLHFAGGLTIPESTPWGTGYASVAPSPKQEIVISLAGPFAGFSFAALVMLLAALTGGTLLTGKVFGLIPMPLTAIMPFGGQVLSIFFSMLLWVNISWGLFNLVPVFPLDGGQVTRNIFMIYDPWDGVRKALWVSVVVGGLLAIGGFVFFRSIYMGALFGMLAFQSFQILQSRH